MGPPGPRRTKPPSPVPCPALLNRLGWDVFFLGFPAPASRLAHPPDGPLLKMGGEKRGLVQGISGGGDHPKYIPPAPV